MPDEWPFAAEDQSTPSSSETKILFGIYCIPRIQDRDCFSSARNPLLLRPVKIEEVLSKRANNYCSAHPRSRKYQSG
jgi:hypothetical protein